MTSDDDLDDWPNTHAAPSDKPEPTANEILSELSDFVAKHGRPQEIALSFADRPMMTLTLEESDAFVEELRKFLASAGS